MGAYTPKCAYMHTAGFSEKHIKNKSNNRFLQRVGNRGIQPVSKMAMVT